jgi:hypothetical protein
VNLLEDNTDIIKKNTETVTDASKELGLEVNAEKKLVHVSVLSPEGMAKSQNEDSKQIS